MNLLSIGGSDPSSGAGIQSDIKTFYELGAYCLTAITAITAQNTSDFDAILPVSKKILKLQLMDLFSDFKIEGVKISMVYNSQIIKTIFQEIKDKKIPIVVDPVIKSTTGGDLLERSSIDDFKKFIIPLATVITPNKFEAEILTKIKINSENSLLKAARIIQNMGAKNVIITGIEKGKLISDFILEKDKHYLQSEKKLSIINHGSGCNYSAALVYSLTNTQTIKEATKFAQKYTFDSIKNAKKIGQGFAITQNRKTDELFNELNQAIKKFLEIKGIYKSIPECQTNFVFTKKNPRSTKDILGINGRIVKTGTRVTVAGNLKYGGSKHVASALLIMNQRFPEICSAINLKYQKEIISKLKRKNFVISYYNREKEPRNIKNKEGSSVEWGIKNAITKSKHAPDVVYHKGDYGKEPMIIMFGKKPNDVLEKVSKYIGK